MNKNETKISLEILILNDLFQRNVIDKNIYDKAAQKIVAASKEKVA